MDHTRDNPLKRFTAFWIGLLLITAFGIACLLFGIFVPEKVDAGTEATANARKAVRSEVDRVQNGLLDQAKLDEAILATSKSLKDSTPTPGKPVTPVVAPTPEAQPEPASE